MDLIPQWFPPLLQKDRILQDLWYGRGKPAGADQSVTGYDATIAAYLATYATRNVDDLTLVLAFRPVGKEYRQVRTVEYLMRTAAYALHTTEGRL